MEENADEDEEDLSPQSAEESWTDTGTIQALLNPQADVDMKSFSYVLSISPFHSFVQIGLDRFAADQQQASQGTSTTTSTQSQHQQPQQQPQQQAQ